MFYILNEHNKGNVELKHFMYLSNLEGFKNKNKVHIGEVFQLSLLTDILIDVQNKLKIDLNLFINENIETIKKRRLKKDIKSWSYFHTVSEIAPDIDDFGQILQVLLKTNQNDYISKICFPLINFIIKNCDINNGGILTWIMPNNNLNDTQKIQNKFNTEKWGKGPDVEVVANFIYSIQLLKNINFQNFILKNIKYIIKEQNELGFWKSRWYFGKYYGTYVCSRVLITESKTKYNNELQKAINYIIKSQNKDGGWGYDEENSDPLNTAFCIITLKLYDSIKYSSYINKANEYLLSVKKENGSWFPVNFIKPRINDSYRSSTLTTAYVLKATL